MWQQQSEHRREFLVVIPEVGDLRNRTARRLVDDDESQSRSALCIDESSHRKALYEHHGTVMKRVLTTLHSEGFHPRDGWERNTLRAFEIAESDQIKAACSEYTPCGTAWMPHDLIRKLYTEWRAYYTRWKRPHVMSSSLLASFFCAMLIDDTLTPDQQIDLSREIVQSALEVTNDAEDNGAEACTYTAFALLIKNLSVVLFAPKHPYVTTHLLAVVLDERVHRAHD
jgi:hypothetical protein